MGDDYLDFRSDTVTRPTPGMRAAVAEALPYGLVDLGRIEQMVLQRVARDIFKLPCPAEEAKEGDDG